MKKFIIIVLFSLPISIFGQREMAKNYRTFDDRIFHFGFMLGTNKSLFDAYPYTEAFEKYKLTSLVAKSAAGGQVGIVTTMKLGHPIARLRFIPSLSFQEKVLTYTYQNADPKKDAIVKEQRVNQTILDFPIMLQFRTMRMNNFTAYCLIGMQPSIDLQSQQYATQNYANPFVKIYKKDFQGQLGGGVEFFAPYFKFGVEVKYSKSFESSFIQDNTPVSLPIQSLYNHVWYLSLIFEG